MPSWSPLSELGLANTHIIRQTCIVRRFPFFSSTWHHWTTCSYRVWDRFGIALRMIYQFSFSSSPEPCTCSMTICVPPPLHLPMMPLASWRSLFSVISYTLFGCRSHDNSALVWRTYSLLWNLSRLQQLKGVCECAFITNKFKSFVSMLDFVNSPLVMKGGEVASKSLDLQVITQTSAPCQDWPPLRVGMLANPLSNQEFPSSPWKI
jgi:hypothetical protein